MRADRKVRAPKTTPAPRPTTPEPRRNLRPHLVSLAALWVIILLTYSNSFRAGFIFDNLEMIVRDPRIRAVTPENLHLIWRGEYWYSEAGNGLYRPLTTLSYLLNYAVLDNQIRPAGYHWVNFVLHAVNASLFYLLGLAIFRRRVVPALALALIWAVHPVLTESVTNIVGRADLLAGFGMLAGVLCYRRGVERTGRQMWIWFLSAALASAVGMFSKESAIIIPLVAVLYDLCFPTASARANRLWGYVALALPSILYFAVRPQLYPLRIAFTDNPLIGAGFLTARLTALKVIGKYIWLLFFPARLSADYSYNAIPLFSWSLRTWSDWQVVISAIVIVAILALAAYGWRRDRRWFFFIGLGALGLAPVANIAKLIGTIMAERFLYIPAMAFAGCLVLAGLAIAQRYPAAERRLLPALAILLAATLAIRTWARNSDWIDNRTMWASMVNAVPNSYKAHAFYYGKTLDDSIDHIGTALSIIKDLPANMSTSIPYINAGVVYRKKGEAVAPTSPADAAAWYHRSLDILLEGERIMKAAGERRFELYEQLGLTYSKLGDFARAIQNLRSAQRLTTSEDLTRELSAAYIQSGDTHTAEIALWEGLLADPGNQHISAWLVDMYQRSNAGSCALQQQPGGWAMNPACPLVHDELCTASANMVRIFRERGLAPSAAELRNTGVTQFGCPTGLY